MTTFLKNFVLVLLAMVMGAALVLGYMSYRQPAANAPLVASAVAAAANAPTPASLFDEEAIASIYERVSPAVVYVTSTGAQRIPSSREAPRIPQLPQLPEVPQLPPRTGTGSGVIIDDQGHILTNNHVVDGASRLDVTLANGDTVQAKLLGRDPGNDLAVLKIDVDKSKLTVASLGDSSKLKAGQMAIAIGNPFGLQRTITVGVISSVGRTYSGGSSARPIQDMIQTDAAINPGNSGGPLLNSTGDVIGITTAIESPVRGSVGIGFAVPINTAKNRLEDLKAGVAITHPWLGISGTPVTSNLAQELGIPEGGVYVVQVVPDSPAAEAGLKGAVRRNTRVPDGQLPKGGDVILAVDDQKVSKVEEISSYLDTKKPGDTVTLTIRRGGEEKQVQVTLAEWPESLDEE